MNGTGSARATTATESGLGDIWFEGRYRLHGQGSAPDVVPYAKAKLGTASRSNGLGTGENDYEAGAGLEWMIGRNLFPFAQAGYRVLGQPPGVTVHNMATYEGGLMVNTGGRDFVTLMVSGNQAAISGQSDVLDFIGAWKHAIAATTDIEAYFDKGLTNGSPDYAFGVGLETRL